MKHRRPRFGKLAMEQCSTPIGATQQGTGAGVLAAFNWISFRAVCPACRAESEMRAQCHVASSFDGDERGRFCDRVHALGSPMDWWPRGDARWRTWVDGVDRHDVAGDRALECCYAHCDRCGANLFAVIEFVDVAPTAILEVGAEDAWPEGFSR